MRLPGRAVVVRSLVLFALVLGGGAVLAPDGAVADSARPSTQHKHKPKPKPKVPRPVVSKVSAISGPTTGGVRVTVTGKHLKAVQKVTFGGLEGMHLSRINAKKLTVVAPPSEVGAAHVRVTTSGGQSKTSAKDVFTYQRYEPIANGYYHTCQVKNGRVRCVGYNGYGDLGDGSTTDSASPVTAIGVTQAVAVTSTNDTTCALSRGGSVWCWGYNAYGQLGDGTTTDSWVPKKVPGLSHVVQIVAGYYQTCAIRSDRSLWCWGQNVYGELGDGTLTDRHTPTRTHGISKVLQVDANYYFTCARTANGLAYCWGHNDDGQLGIGSLADSPHPARVVGLTHVSSISTAWYTACAASRGRAFCWGENSYGTVGDGTTTSSTVPRPVSALRRVSQVSGGGDYNCALADGSAFCWGESYYGELGNDAPTGTGSAYAHTPAGVQGGEGVSFLSSGAYTSCFVRGAATRCWGSNDYGQVGDGTTTTTNVPVTADLG